MKKFLSYLKENKLNYITFNKDDARKYIKYLNEIELKSSSISRMLSSLRSFYAYLIINERINYNPFKLIRNPKKDKKLPTFLSDQEFIDILNHIKEDELSVRNKLIIELLYATGLRVSELTSIKLNDINYNDKSIRILGKGNKERVVYFGSMQKIV
jgi:integrase/recombinase XerC